MHGDRYSYDWDTYTVTTKKMAIICRLHGEFYQRPNDHKNGQGCPKCKCETISKLRILPFKDVLKDFINTHGNKYNYFEETYTESKIKMKIECPIHGIFYQAPDSHKNGCGCPKCKGDTISKKTSFPFCTVKESFIKIHGNKYNYFEETYTNTTKKMKIQCPIHGIFEKSPKDHKNGRGCPHCKAEENKEIREFRIREKQSWASNQKNTIQFSLDEFILSCSKTHENKYKYFKESYINSETNMKIQCPIHDIFYQRPSKHKDGHGCPKCSEIKRRESKTIKFDDLILICKMAHKDKYKYFEEGYINSKTKLKIECPIHGIFYQYPNSHKNGAGCQKCGIEKVSKLRRIPFDDIVSSCRKIHGDKYNYFEETYTIAQKNMKIECKIHGIFYQKPIKHKSGQGCPSCCSSKVEEVISNYLLTNNIKFKRQKTFNGCVLSSKLRFDFYMPSINTCIEYDGEQHSNFTEIWHKDQDGFDLQKLKDKIKNDYCKNNNIRLIRISYLDFDNIEKILDQSLI